MSDDNEIGAASGATATAPAPHAAQQSTAGDASAAEVPPHAPPTASIDALEFTITVPRAQALFAQHDRKVPEDRTLQNYCKTGHLVGRKITHLNEEGKTVTEWLIHEPSLLTYIRSQPILKNEPGVGAAGVASTTAPTPHAAQQSTAGDASIAEVPPHATQASPLQTQPIVSANQTPPAPETDLRLLDALVDNARLTAQVEAKDQIIKRLDDVIDDLKHDKEIYVEELRSNRGERSDTRSITERLLDTIRSLGTGGRGSPVQDRPVEAHIIHSDRQPG